MKMMQKLTYSGSENICQDFAQLSVSRVALSWYLFR